MMDSDTGHLTIQKFFVIFTELDILAAEESADILINHNITPHFLQVEIW